MGELLAGRLAEDVPQTDEDFHELCRLGQTRIEHIVSSAHPDTGEQVQSWDEWVLVAAGWAVLELAGDQRRLTQGDWLLIPAGMPHRVLSTRAGTQWIAVHHPERSRQS